MKKLIKILCTAFLLTSVADQIQAEEPIAPPFLYPQERWEMYYDDYRADYWYYFRGEGWNPYLSNSREVAVVRDGDDLYIKGVFEKYPESWIKGTVTDDVFQLVPDQVICNDEETGEEIYLCWGAGDMKCQYRTGYAWVTFTPGYWDRPPLGDYDGNNIGRLDIPMVSEGIFFWYVKKSTRTQQIIFKEGDMDGGYWQILPDVGFFSGPEFHKIDESGIGNSNSNVTDCTDKIMYDLQGRIVNPETALPGIYIRNGKKIVKR